MKPWVESVLKVVIRTASMCCGIRVAKNGVRIGDEGLEGGQRSRTSQQELDRAA